MAFQNDSIYWVEVEKIVPNPFQPRREFNQDALKELADSIRMYGILQPLTVTRKEVQREDGTFYSEYELIAGERRLRASKIAGVVQVPVIIRDGDQSEQEKLELAIIENLQREDLSAVDRALAFRQLADMFGLSHGQVATKVGRSREYVSNSIRLLGLPEYLLDALRKGDVSEGHARTLLTLNDRPEEQEVLFREILLKKLSVREVERIVRTIATDKVRKKTLDAMDVDLLAIERQFTETLGTRVQIMKTEFGGKLTIDYFSVTDLEHMLERMKAEAAEPFKQVRDDTVAVATLTNATPLEMVTEVPTPPPVVPVGVNSPLEEAPEAPVPNAQDAACVPAAALPVAEPTLAVEREPVAEKLAPEVIQQAVEPIPDVPTVKPMSALASALERVLGIPPAPTIPSATTPTAPVVSVPAQPRTTPPPVSVPASVSAPAVGADAHSIGEENVTPEVQATPTPTPNDTDDDLYSIRNFNV